MFLQVVSALSVLLSVCYWQICDLYALSRKKVCLLSFLTIEVRG